MPAFMKYDAHDKLPLPLDAVDDQVVAAWVEEKLLAFVETYLRLDRGDEDFEDEAVTDPVCGMRISRSSAAAHMEHRGHPYFFCTEDCRRQFAENPERYVRVVTP
jgi:YHS domain-containing protein